jgi:hypothetical protein
MAWRARVERTVREKDATPEVAGSAPLGPPDARTFVELRMGAWFLGER